MFEEWDFKDLCDRKYIPMMNWDFKDQYGSRGFAGDKYCIDSDRIWWCRDI